MPWSEATAMEQTSQSIRDRRAARHTVADLCRLYDCWRRLKSEPPRRLPSEPVSARIT